MDQFLAQLRALFAKHGYPIVLGGVTLVTVVAAAWVAIPARKERALLAAEDARLAALIKSSNLWVTQFEPASNEEAAIWQETASQVDALGVRPSERLTLAQIVSRRAEDAGISGTHIKFVPIDPATGVPARQVAGITFNSAPYKLEVTGSGSVSALSRFLETLPPAVQVQAVNLTQGGAGVSTALSLSVFEPAGGNAK